MASRSTKQDKLGSATSTPRAAVRVVVYSGLPTASIISAHPHYTTWTTFSWVYIIYSNGTSRAIDDKKHVANFTIHKKIDRHGKLRIGRVGTAHYHLAGRASPPGKIQTQGTPRSGSYLRTPRHLLEAVCPHSLTVRSKFKPKGMKNKDWEGGGVGIGGARDPTKAVCGLDGDLPRGDPEGMLLLLLLLTLLLLPFLPIHPRSQAHVLTVVLFSL